MIVRNLLHSGEYAVPVPLGMMVRLKYNLKGELDTIYRGFDEGGAKLPSKILKAVKMSSIVPLTVAIKNVATFVEGVFYRHPILADGLLPEAAEPLYLEALEEHTDQFSFYAANAQSSTAVFRGMIPTRTWLTAAGFTMLPGFVVPADIDDSVFGKLAAKFPFEYPLYTHFVIFKGLDVVVRSTHLSCSWVKDSKLQVSLSGFVSQDIEFTDQTRQQYSQDMVYGYSLRRGNCVVFDQDRVPIWSKGDPVSSYYICGTCGAKIHLIVGAPTRCSNKNCMSRLYPRIAQFLQILQLPVISEERYQELVDSGEKLFSVSDVLDLPEYEDVKVITNLERALRSIIPDEVDNNGDLVRTICKECDNKLIAVERILDDPDLLMSEMKLPGCSALHSWLSDKEMRLDIDTVLHHPKIEIKDVRVSAGVPLFHGKVIAVTGKFVRGDYDFIKSVLESHDCSVTQSSLTVFDCLVVGSTDEEIDGRLVRIAKSNNVPIFTENEFFENYRLDEFHADLV